MNPNPSNVTSIESKQAQPQCRFTITAQLRGFPITIEGEGRAGDLKIIVDRLLAAGAEPPQAAQASTPAQSEPAKASAPLCPVHGSKMKPSRKPGGFYCPRQNDDGSYCAETA